MDKLKVNERTKRVIDGIIRIHFEKIVLRDLKVRTGVPGGSCTYGSIRKGDMFADQRVAIVNVSNEFYVFLFAFENSATDLIDLNAATKTEER